MLHWANYVMHGLRARQAGDRLVMTILCKDEVDIIEAVIHVHARLGVDAFAVMDNGSTDGTRERLATLAKTYELLIVDEPSQTYQQARWMTRLAHIARQKLRPRWVISSDADEFWLPQQGGLKDYLRPSDSVISVPRSNMLLTEAAMGEHYSFTQAEFRVQYPLGYDGDAQRNDDLVSMLLVPIKPKVIVNPHGLLQIKGGNHRARHIGAPLTARHEAGIRIYHYPIRSWRQFEAKIQHRRYLLREHNSRMGQHYKRWVRLLEEGRLEEEFRRIVLPDNALACFLQYGVACRDTRPGEILRDSGVS